MKNILILAALLSLSTQAREVLSDRANAEVNIARVVSVTNLVNKPGIMVNVSVQDLGGSTDVSHTQKIFLNLYAKGEMFSTDASFEITGALSLKAARRISGGIYEIDVEQYNDVIETVTYQIDATQAIVAIKSVNCGEEFDCAAANHFSSQVSVTRR